MTMTNETMGGSPARTTGPQVDAPSGEGLAEAHDVLRRLFDRVSRAVIGRDEVIELVLIALVADGHVLLEDFPGSGKTTLAKALGEAILDDRPADSRGLVERFRRIQFTPDLLPSDITGTSIFEPSTGALRFAPGPVFAHVVLADEINRTSPKVQAALLEAMAEKQVTVDGGTRPLDDLFFVIATQNPLDLAGTYPLPVAQLDRFLFKVRMTHISRESELEVLRSISLRSRPAPEASGATRSEVLRARAVIRSDVTVHGLVEEALVDAASALRADRRVLQGVSTRALVLAVPALQARAMLYGRDYVDSSDLEALLPKVFAHRVELGAGAAEVEPVIEEALRPALERLARATLRGGGSG
jgi:MoxR-like ATPase